jgi:hypothetical protein
METAVATTRPYHKRTAPGPRTRPTVGDGGDAAIASTLAGIAAATLVCYALVFVLMLTPGMRPVPTPFLQSGGWLSRFAVTPEPGGLPAILPPLHDDSQVVDLSLYGLVMLTLVGLWGAALWVTRSGAGGVRLRWVLLATVAYCAPLLILPGMFSADVYTHIFYGRIIDVHGANPFLVAPNQFPADHFYPWLNWKSVTSVYGTVWLLYSAAVSALPGDSMLASLLWYKAGVLLLHLLTTAVVWRMLREAKPRLAVWGAIFYGWNPLVLFEVVGNGHNEALMAALVVLSLYAARRGRWLTAVLLLAAAGMAKLPALVLLPPLALAWARTRSGWRAQLRSLAVASAVALLGALALSAPLGAGMSLADNLWKVAGEYRIANSPWVLLALKLTSPGDLVSLAATNAGLDVARMATLATLFLIGLWEVWKRRELAEVWVWLWFAFCFTAAWVWPWYLALAVPVAALRGPGRAAALAAALTAGGLLFWLWRPSGATDSWWSEYRAVVLFGPAVLVATGVVAQRVRRAIPRLRSVVARGACEPTLAAAKPPMVE